MRLDYSPWEFTAGATDAQREAQRRHQARLLAAHPGWELGEGCFLSPLASVQCEEFALGPRGYVAAHAYATHDVRLGRDCTVNAFTVLRGRIRIGDAVRIGAHTSIIAFNHGTADPDVEVFRQPHTSEGVTIGDDVWIGSHVVVLDGVRVGSRSVLAAGAVVTRDVPAGAVVGGNPARVLRWRVPGLARAAVGDGLAARLARLEERARAQAREVLDRCFDPDLSGGQFVDAPGAPPRVRAQCDAVEIADLLLDGPPPQLPAEEQAERLLRLQDAATGLVGEFGPDGRPGPAPRDWFDGTAAYHVLSVGYALDLLGREFAHPVRVVAEAHPATLLDGLARQPWTERAWSAGAWVDAVGTALRWNLARGEQGVPGTPEALFGWLATRIDPRTGTWGTPRAEDGSLQVVNAYYRTTRGTYAQFGLPVPHAERTVDTVLAHAGDRRFFAPEAQNACNVLDVAHPLWLLSRQTGHRREEVVALARRLLSDVVDRWSDGRGFAFQAPGPAAEGLPATVPGLQGTEMWLATTWLLADLAGLSGVLGYRPRGVHRPEPALALAAPT
ncbi:acyltransferase [Kineococcus sp. R8]|nr:acyltransferase [Kineococcus siccus]